MLEEEEMRKKANAFLEEKKKRDLSPLPKKKKNWSEEKNEDLGNRN